MFAIQVQADILSPLRRQPHFSVVACFLSSPLLLYSFIPITIPPILIFPPPQLHSHKFLSMSSRKNSNLTHSLIPYASSDSAAVEDNNNDQEQLSDSGNSDSHENLPAASSAFPSVSATINNWRASSNKPKSKSEDTQAKNTRYMLNALASLPILPGSARNTASTSSSNAFELAQNETNQGLKRAKVYIKGSGKTTKNEAGVASSSKSKPKSKLAKGKAKMMGTVIFIFSLYCNLLSLLILF